MTATTTARARTASTIWPILEPRKKSMRTSVRRGAERGLRPGPARVAVRSRPRGLELVQDLLGVRTVDPVDHAAPEGPGTELGRTEVRADVAGVGGVVLEQIGGLAQAVSGGARRDDSTSDR